MSTELITKVAGALMVAETKSAGLTGEEREHNVIENLCHLDDNVVGLGLIPNELEAEVVEYGVDELQEAISKIDLESFVKTEWQKIKHLFHKN